MATGALAFVLLITSCAPSTPAPSTSSADPSPSASAEPPDTEAEVATATATLKDGTVDVIVRSLERDDNGTTMTLRAAFVPHLGKEGESYTLSSINGYIFLRPVLLDRQNLKRYSVIEGDGQQEWLTNTSAETVEGEPLESWFVYAAPEDDIDEITFTIDEWSIELPDIPIGGDR